MNCVAVLGNDSDGQQWYIMYGTTTEIGIRVCVQTFFFFFPITSGELGLRSHHIFRKIEKTKYIFVCFREPIYTIVILVSIIGIISQTIVLFYLRKRINYSINVCYVISFYEKNIIFEIFGKLLKAPCT